MSRASAASDVFTAIAEPRRRQIIDLLAAPPRPGRGGDRAGAGAAAAGGVETPGRAAGGRHRLRQQAGPTARVRTEPRPIAARLRLGQDVRTALGAPARPHQSDGPSGGARRSVEHVRANNPARKEPHDHRHTEREHRSKPSRSTRRSTLRPRSKSPSRRCSTSSAPTRK